MFANLNRRQRDAIAGYSMSFPAVLLFVVFIGLPFVAALVLSLYQWDLLTPASFIGFDNFVTLAADPIFWVTMRNTAIIAVSAVVLQVGGGLMLALLANQQISRVVSYFFRSAIFAPFLIAWAAVSLLWMYTLDPAFGIMNYFLGQIGVTPPNWLVSQDWALPALIGIDWWHHVGYAFVILLAGLQTVPKELTEAAITDGASAWRRLIHVTIPCMAPTLVFITAITFINAFRIFEPMRIITQGGPDNSTKSIIQYLYENAFEKFQVGYGSAVAAIVFVVVMVITLLQLRLTRKWVDNE